MNQPPWLRFPICQLLVSVSVKTCKPEEVFMIENESSCDIGQHRLITAWLHSSLLMGEFLWGGNSWVSSVTYDKGLGAVWDMGVACWLIISMMMCAAVRGFVTDSLDVWDLLFIHHHFSYFRLQCAMLNYISYQSVTQAMDMHLV